MEVSTASHANRILQAWDTFNYARFEVELDRALASCARSLSRSELENEERAVLESAARQLRHLPPVSDNTEDGWWTAPVLLLRHLEAR
jgi:hypothetical protein